MQKIERSQSNPLGVAGWSFSLWQKRQFLRSPKFMCRSMIQPTVFFGLTAFVGGPTHCEIAVWSELRSPPFGLEGLVPCPFNSYPSGTQTERDLAATGSALRQECFGFLVPDAFEKGGSLGRGSRVEKSVDWLSQCWRITPVACGRPQQHS